MFRRFAPVLRRFFKRSASSASQSSSHRAVGLLALMALTLVHLTGEAAASNGCTAFAGATLDSSGSYISAARNTFQVGDTLHVEGPSGNQIFFNMDSNPSQQAFPFNYNIQASDINGAGASVSNYFTFNYTDGPPTDITLSCVAAPVGRAQRISLSGLNQTTTVTVGTPTPFSATSTSGLPVTIAPDPANNGANCSISGSGGGSFTLTATAVGQCAITASVAGNGSYDAFTDNSFINVTATGGAATGGTPVLTGITPATSVNGGETATITGSNLDNVTGILFGNKSVLVSPGNRASGQIQITIPAFADAASARGSAISIYAVAPGSGGTQLQSNRLTFTYTNVAISLTASKTSLNTTDTVDLAATVTPSTATGTVTFTATSTTGGAPITSTVGLTGGQAPKTLGPFATGSYNVTATYNGDSTYNSVTSAPPIPLTVAAPALNVTAAQSLVNLTVDSSASLPLTVVNVTGGSGGYGYAPNRNTPLPYGLSLNASGQLAGAPKAAFNGTITIDVTSGGVTQSANFTLNVAKASPTISISASKTQFSSTDTTTLTATVTPPTATGAVTFTVGANTPVTVPVGAPYTVGPLPAGNPSVSATYSGDANYKSVSGSLAGGLTVTATPQTVALGPISTTGVAGATAIFTASSTSKRQVTFSVDGASNICNVAPQTFDAASGSGSYLLTYTNGGQCSISASVAGDATYAPFSATAFVVVTVAAAGTPHLDSIDHIFTITGGETATISGSNLDKVTSINFGGATITPATVAAGRITFSVPPAPASVSAGGRTVQVSVVVGSSGVVSTNSLPFTYYPLLTYSPAATISTINIGPSVTIDLGGAGGGFGSYTYAITSNSNSNAISFPNPTSTNGQFAVSAQAVGSSDITVTVTDRSGQSKSRSFKLNAAYPTLSVTPVNSTVNLTLKTPISSPIKVINATDGDRTYVYAPNPASALSDLGLSIDSNGQLNGTPTSTFNGAITINVTSAGETKSVTFTLVIAKPNAAITLTASKDNPGRTETADFIAKVRPANATGTVTFTIGVVTYPPVPLDSSGVATLRAIGPLPDGAYSSKAVYSGDDLYDGVTSETLQVRWGIRPDPTADKNVRAIVAAQAATTLRMAGMQIDTVQRRLETLHEDDVPGFVNGLSVSAPSSQPSGASPFDDPVLRGQGLSQSPASKALDRTFDKNFGKDFNRAAERDGAPRNSFGALETSRFKVWTAGSVIFGGVQVSSLGVVSKTYFTLAGLTAGVDTQLMDGLRGGFAMSYSGEGADIGSDGSRMNSKGLTGSLYGSWRIAGKVFLDGTLGYGDLSFATKRFDGNAGDFIMGQRRGKMVFGSLALTYDEKMGPLKFSPYARLDVIDATLNAYTEAGDPNWVLAYDKAGLGSRSLVLGLRGQYDFEQPWGVVSPTWRVEYRRMLSGELTQMMTYATDPSTAYNLTVRGSDRDTLSAALGLKAKTRGEVATTLEYLLGGGLKSGLQGQGMRGMVKVGF